LSSEEVTAQAKKKKNSLDAYSEAKVIPFDWATAERVEIKSQMI